MTEDDLEELGLMVDSLDNALAASSLPLPPETHVRGLTGIISGVRDKLRAFVVEKLGHDPWDED